MAVSKVPTALEGKEGMESREYVADTSSCCSFSLWQVKPFISPPVSFLVTLRLSDFPLLPPVVLLCVLTRFSLLVLCQETFLSVAPEDTVFFHLEAEGNP